MENNHNINWEQKVLQLSESGCTCLDDNDFSKLKSGSALTDVVACSGKVADVNQLCQEAMDALQARHTEMKPVKVLCAVFLQSYHAASVEDLQNLPAVLDVLGDEVELIWGVVTDAEQPAQDATIVMWMGYDGPMAE